MATKEETRRHIAEAVKRLTESERAAKSTAISQRLSTLPELHQARVAMGFVSMSDELDTMPILEDLIAAGKRVYVPRTHIPEREMVPLRLRNVRDLRVGAYGILEPLTEETCTIPEIEFLFVPGRAFDGSGNRLGRGAGFYDRFMGNPKFRATRCGVCFNCQLLEEVPHEQFDIPVQILVTEDQTLRFPH